MLLSIVVPVHNEGASLASLIQALHHALSDHFPGNFEVIIVDDGSDASTKQALENPPDGFRVITLSGRRGSGAARRLASAQARGRLCAWIDGDSTYAVKDLIMLADGIGLADQVIGARSTDHGRWLWTRRLVKRAACALASCLWMKRIPDLNSGLRVFRRQAMAAWLDELPAGFSCTSTATLAALNLNQSVVFKPIAYHARPAGTRSKFHPFYDSWRLLGVILRQARRRWIGPRAKLRPAS